MQNPETHSCIYEHLNYDQRGTPKKRVRKDNLFVSGSGSTGYLHGKE